MIPTPESAVLRAGLDHFTLIGWNVSRKNTGAIAATSSSGRKRFVRFGAPGDPDLSGWSPWGIHVAAEAKRPDGSNKLSPEQITHLRRARFCGCIVIVFGSVDDVIAGVEIAWLEALRLIEPLALAGVGCPDRLLRMSYDQRAARLKSLIAQRAESEARYLPRGEKL